MYGGGNSFSYSVSDNKLIFEPLIDTESEDEENPDELTKEGENLESSNILLFAYLSSQPVFLSVNVEFT